MSSGGTYILLACYNDGSAVIKLLLEIENVLKNFNSDFNVVVIDDGSNDATRQVLNKFSFNIPNFHYRLLQLPYNHGHQGAIEQGILFAHACGANNAIIMDGDGEDDPAAIPELFNYHEYDIIHVVRGKRSEKFGFRFAYKLYVELFRLVTGKQMDFGNFCMINTRVLNIIHSKSFIHLAAFLTKLKLKSAYIVSNRRSRLDGHSKMTVTDLVHHALRSFVEYAEEMVMLFLRLFVILFLLFIVTMVYILYLKLFTTKAIVGWTSTLGIGLLASALLCIGFFITGVLLLNLSYRRQQHGASPVYKIII